MGDSWVLCKSAVLAANRRPWMGQASLGRPRQKNVQPDSISTWEPSSGSVVSLIAAMSILYLTSSQAISAMRLRAPCQVSYTVRIFQLATTSGRCFIEEFTLYFFRPHVGLPCGFGRPPGKGGTGNVRATFSMPIHRVRWAVWILRLAAQSTW